MILGQDIGSGRAKEKGVAWDTGLENGKGKGVIN
jgi:hypothetical protein